MTGPREKRAVCAAEKKAARQSRIKMITILLRIKSSKIVKALKMRYRFTSLRENDRIPGCQADRVVDCDQELAIVENL